jgi:hypothetical protein
MANSVLTATITLTTQDATISSTTGQNMVQRVEPSFVYQSGASIIYGGYLSLAPAASVTIAPNSGFPVGFLYVRNATVGGTTSNAENAIIWAMTVTYQDTASAQICVTTLIPGGFLSTGNPGVSPTTIGIISISVSNPTANTLIAEYMYAQ